MRRYYAVDPGGTTGVAWLIDGQWGGGQLKGRAQANLWISRALQSAEQVGDRATLIIERWDVRADTAAKSAQDDARYIIGWAEGLCTVRHPGVEYVEQRPYTVKGKRAFVDDLKLKKMGLWVPGKDHERDARKHLAAYLITSVHDHPEANRLRAALL